MAEIKADNQQRSDVAPQIERDREAALDPLEAKTASFKRQAELKLSILTRAFGAELTESLGKSQFTALQFQEEAFERYRHDQSRENPGLAKLDLLAGLPSAEKLRNQSYSYPLGEGLIEINRYNISRVREGLQPVVFEPSIFVTGLPDLSAVIHLPPGIDRFEIRSAQIETLIKIQAALTDNGIPLNWGGVSAGSVGELRAALGEEKFVGFQQRTGKLPAVHAVKDIISELHQINDERVRAGREPLELPQLKEYQSSLKLCETLSTGTLRGGYERIGGYVSELFNVNENDASWAQQPKSDTRAQQIILIDVGPKAGKAESFKALEGAAVDELVSIYDRLQLGIPLQEIGLSANLRQALKIPGYVGSAQATTSQSGLEQLLQLGEQRQLPTEIAVDSLKLPYKEREAKLLRAAAKLEELLSMGSNQIILNAEFENTGLHRVAEFIDPLAWATAQRQKDTIAGRAKLFPEQAKNAGKEIEQGIDEFKKLVREGKHSEAIVKLAKAEQTYQFINDLVGVSNQAYEATEFRTGITIATAPLMAADLNALFQAAKQSLPMTAARAAAVRAAGRGSLDLVGEASYKMSLQLAGKPALLRELTAGSLDNVSSQLASGFSRATPATTPGAVGLSSRLAPEVAEFVSKLPPSFAPSRGQTSLIADLGGVTPNHPAVVGGLFPGSKIADSGQQLRFVLPGQAAGGDGAALGFSNADGLFGGGSISGQGGTGAAPKPAGGGYATYSPPTSGKGGVGTGHTPFDLGSAKGSSAPKLSPNGPQGIQNKLGEFGGSSGLGSLELDFTASKQFEIGSSKVTHFEPSPVEIETATAVPELPPPHTATGQHTNRVARFFESPTTVSPELPKAIPTPSRPAAPVEIPTSAPVLPSRPDMGLGAGSRTLEISPNIPFEVTTPRTTITPSESFTVPSSRSSSGNGLSFSRVAASPRQPDEIRRLLPNGIESDRDGFEQEQLVRDVGEILEKELSSERLREELGQLGLSEEEIEKILGYKEQLSSAHETPDRATAPGVANSPTMSAEQPASGNPPQQPQTSSLPTTELPLGISVPTPGAIRTAPIEELTANIAAAEQKLNALVDANRDRLANLSLTGRGENDLAQIMSSKSGGSLYVWTVKKPSSEAGALTPELLTAAQKSITYSTLQNPSRQATDPNPGGIIILQPPGLGEVSNHRNSDVINGVEIPGYTNDPTRAGETTVRVGPDNFEQVVTGVVPADSYLGWAETEQNVARRANEAMNVGAGYVEVSELEFVASQLIYNDAHPRIELARRAASIAVLTEVLNQLSVQSLATTPDLMANTGGVQPPERDASSNQFRENSVSEFRRALRETLHSPFALDDLQAVAPMLESSPLLARLFFDEVIEFVKAEKAGSSAISEYALAVCGDIRSALFSSSESPLNRLPFSEQIDICARANLHPEIQRTFGSTLVAHITYNMSWWNGNPVPQAALSICKKPEPQQLDIIHQLQSIGAQCVAEGSQSERGLERTIELLKSLREGSQSQLVKYSVNIVLSRLGQELETPSLGVIKRMGDPADSRVVEQLSDSARAESDKLRRQVRPSDPQLSTAQLLKIAADAVAYYDHSSLPTSFAELDISKLPEPSRYDLPTVRVLQARLEELQDLALQNPNDPRIQSSFERLFPAIHAHTFAKDSRVPDGAENAASVIALESTSLSPLEWENYIAAFNARADFHQAQARMESEILARYAEQCEKASIEFVDATYRLLPQIQESRPDLTELCAKFEALYRDGVLEQQFNCAEQLARRSEARREQQRFAERMKLSQQLINGSIDPEKFNSLVNEGDARAQQSAPDTPIGAAYEKMRAAHEEANETARLTREAPLPPELVGLQLRAAEANRSMKAVKDRLPEVISEFWAYIQQTLSKAEEGVLQVRERQFDSIASDPALCPFPVETSEQLALLVRHLHRPELRTAVETDLGIRLSEIPLRNQVHLIRYLSKQDATGFSNLRDNLREHPEVANEILNAFLANAEDAKYTEALLQITRNADSSSLKQILYKYNELSDATYDLEREFNEVFKLEASPTRIHEATKHLLHRANVFLADFAKRSATPEGVAGVIEELDNVHRSVALFASTFRTLRVEGNVPEFSAIEKTEMTVLTADKLSDEQRAAMRANFLQNVASYKESGYRQFITEGFEKTLQDPNARFYILEHDGKVITQIYFVSRTDNNGTPYLYSGGFYSSPTTIGSGVGAPFFNLTNAAEGEVLPIVGIIRADNQYSKAHLNIGSGFEAFDEVPFPQGNEGVESRRIIRYPQSTATEARPTLDLPPPAQY